MGGHGGLNILPQKRWNVYNYENREKVRRDEEAAAREDQLKREQSRRRDSEFRLERLRQARGLATAPSSSPAAPSAAADTAAAGAEEAPPPSDSRHINLFDGVPDFASLAGQDEGKRPLRGEQGSDGGGDRNPKRRRKEEEPPKVVTPEDEKYRLGYGVAGKGVKAPWYLTKPSASASAEDALDERAKVSGSSNGGDGSAKRSGGKKSIEELREERMMREKQEKGRERALLAASMGKKRADRRFSRRAT